jgi:ribonuclease HII
MNGRTWKNQNPKTLEQIKTRLLGIGGTETGVTNEHELWRVKIADSVFISFRTGTLYHTPSNSNSPEVMIACQEIDSTAGTGYVPPSRDYLIGLDETGKGEIAGPVVLTGVIFHKDLFEDFVMLAGPADTKKQHPFEYWRKIYGGLNSFRGDNFNFVAEIISPKLIDKYNINQLLDLFYQKIISNLLKSATDGGCRIVLDDYGAAEDLKKWGFDKNEMMILPRAEDRFIEAKIASLISKKIREGIMENINELPQYQIDGISIGNGNISNSKTADWLSQWHAGERPWPWFIKKSFKTIRDLEGQSDKVKKISPVLKNELLPQDFIRSPQREKAKMNLSAIECSNCGKFQQVLHFDFEQMICQTCKNPMDDLQLTLRHYCSSLIADPRIVEQKSLIRDLENAAFFENYRMIIPWTDSLKQKSKFVEGSSELEENELLGRFILEYFKVNERKDINIQIIEKALESNSMLITSSLRHREEKPTGINNSGSNLVDLAIWKKVPTCIIG